MEDLSNFMDMEVDEFFKVSTTEGVGKCLGDGDLIYWCY